MTKCQISITLLPSYDILGNMTCLSHDLHTLKMEIVIIIALV